jgi:hypothetical protein
METSSTDGRDLDVISVGELVVDFISVEQTDTERMIDREALYDRLESPAEQRV